MWVGVQTSCIILMGDVFTIHCKSVGVDEKNVILALNNYRIPLKRFQSCILKMVKLIIRLGNIFPY